MSPTPSAVHPDRATILRQASRHPLAHRVARGLARACVADADPLVLAVSGGGDSLAMLVLVAALRARVDPSLAALHVISVDHGLRPANREECEGAVRTARMLGVAHAEIRAVEVSQVGNLLDAARDARLDAIAGFAASNGVRKVLLAHQADDRAEGLLLALARGAGIDALCALLPARELALGGRPSLELCRPLLETRRSELRAFLSDVGVAWHDDPSNELRTRGTLRGTPEAAALLDRIADNAGLALEEAHEMVAHRDALAHGLIASDGVSVARAELERCPPFVQREAARMIVHAAGGTPNRAALASLAEALARGDRAPRRYRCEGGVELVLDAAGLRAFKAS
jgi:tRNA(Ile)-lysidine synthase